jgi:hypothetical protein
MTPSGFYLQYTGQRADRLVGFASTLTDRAGNHPGVVFSPLGSSDRLQRLYSATRPTIDAFLDPCGYLIDRDASQQRERHYPWLDTSYGRPSKTAEWQAWMQASIDHQTTAQGMLGAAGQPEIVVAPSPYLRAAATPGELYPVLDAWFLLHTERGGDLWLSLDLDREFLREETHLIRLADALVDASPPGLILRYFQADLAPVGDRRALEGLHEVVTACAAARIPVFLPNCGWTGWLAMAWGADGFSGGLSKGSWYDRWPTPMSPPTPENKIFETAVLRHVTWLTQQALVNQPGYTACQCDSCQAMGTSFNADEASLHQIRVGLELGNELAGLSLTERASRVRDRLDDAIAFRDGLSNALQGRVAAGFLDTWRSLV